MSVKAGDYVADGSVKWIVADVRDGCPVGGVFYAWDLPDGYVRANGATVNRSDYPRLVDFATEHSLWDNANDEDYGTGDGENTFRLPDFTAQFSSYPLIPCIKY